MSIVRSYSLIYLVLSGQYVGRKCVIHDPNFVSSKSVQVIFTGRERDEFASVDIGCLALLDLPGWSGKIYHRPYGLKEHLESKSGSGENMLRTPYVVQPWALNLYDILATGEIVIGHQRRGYNSSCLVHLSRTGWVELEPRLPIALAQNEKYCPPIELRKGQYLITGDIIARDPDSTELNWVNIYLERPDCRIEVPSCIPLALA